MARTPGPWKVGAGGCRVVDLDTGSVSTAEDDCILTLDDREVVGCSEWMRMSEEDAAFIVRACNSHDDLLAALKIAVETIRIWHGFGNTEPRNDAEVWALYQSSPEMQTITAAIAKAEGR